MIENSKPEREKLEKEIEKIAKQIDPDGTFLDDIRGICEKRFSKKAIRDIYGER